MRSNESLDLKIVVLGDSNCGKTTIIHRYINSAYIERPLSTVGAGLYKRESTIEGVEVSSSIWDTAGEERFRSVAPSIIRGADACILVYDVTQADSFNEIDYYFDMISEVMDLETVAKVPIMILGNKADLNQDVVPQAMVNEWKRKRRINMYKVTSAKSGIGIEEAFTDLTMFLISNARQKTEGLTKFIVRPQNDTNQKRKCCK